MFIRMVELNTESTTDISSTLRFKVLVAVQCSLHLPFFKGVEKMIDECGETRNPENHVFKTKSYIVFCFLAEFCLN
jgi:hypothetical protein